MPPPELFSESPDGKPCNLITRENYEYLRDSFFRYASLMKKEAVHAPGLTMAEGITRLHDEMSDLVGNDMNVNIEQDGERLIFRLWKCHRRGELTLYYFPVKFVENLGPELRRISVTFIHNLMQANGIDTILDEDDTEYALTWLAEENDDEQDDRKKRLKLLHSYEKGRIHSLLRRVERKSCSPSVGRSGCNGESGRDAGKHDWPRRHLRPGRHLRLWQYGRPGKHGWSRQYVRFAIGWRFWKRCGRFQRPKFRSRIGNGNSGSFPAQPRRNDGCRTGRRFRDRPARDGDPSR